MQRTYSDALIESILREWLEPLDDVRVCPHEDSLGLSDARVWQVFSANEKYCLKCWPIGQYSQQELESWHDLLRHTFANGFRTIPLPQVAHTGSSVVCRNNQLWDLTTWLPGTVCRREDCDAARLDAMLCCLAGFHQAARSFQKPIRDLSPGLQKRLDILRHISTHGSEQIQLALLQTEHPWRSLLKDLLAEVSRVTPAILGQLQSRAFEEFSLQWCLRDTKYDHFLFEGEQVSGLIDYGAAAVESVAGDISRLAGSILGSGAIDWESVFASYEFIRPLSPEERAIAPLFHEAGTVAAAANWLRWILLEKRNFPRERTVQAQLEWLLKCLKNLT